MKIIGLSRIATFLLFSLILSMTNALAYRLQDLGGRAFGIPTGDATYSFSLDPDAQGMGVSVACQNGGQVTAYFNRTVAIVPETGDTTRIEPVSVIWHSQTEVVGWGYSDIDFLDGTFRFYEMGTGTQTVTLTTNTRYVFTIDAAVYPNADGSLATNSSYAHMSFPSEIVDAPPTIGGIVATPSLAQIGTIIGYSAAFAYPDVGQTFSATWNWGDGTSDTGAVTSASGNGEVSGQHAYADAGVYTVTVTLTDTNNLSSTAQFQYEVVYDPSAGFVTGGGWFVSSPGAYQLDPTLAGMATFGFVSKYQKGANVPTGQTQFVFQTGHLQFASTSYDWLVISGGKATYKGNGTINGAGTYSFMISAIDGNYSGKGNPDLLRVKIWDPQSGALVYDNQMSATEDASPSTQISGGSIVIHQ